MTTEMPRKKTLLVMDNDWQIKERAFDALFSRKFPEESFPRNSYEMVFVSNFLDAVKELYNPEREIAGVIINQDIRLSGHGLHSEEGSYRHIQFENDSRKKQQEGGNGVMLLRLMRTGETGAQSASSRKKLGTIELDARITMGAGYEQRQQELKQTPVVCNMDNPTTEWLQAVEPIALGAPATHGHDKIVLERGAFSIDPFTGYCDHKFLTHAFEFLARKITPEAQASLAPPQHLEAEFDRAIRDKDMKALMRVIGTRANELPTESINRAIGHIITAYGDDTTSIEILDRVLSLPNVDVNKPYSVVRSIRGRVVTEEHAILYDAVVNEATSVVGRLLKMDGINVTQDIIDVADDEIERLLNAYVSRQKNELPGPAADVRDLTLTPPEDSRRDSAERG